MLVERRPDTVNARAGKAPVHPRSVPSSFHAFTDYNAIPHAYHSQVPYSPTSRYIYRDNQVYVVDPATRAVTSIIKPHLMTIPISWRP